MTSYEDCIQQIRDAKTEEESELALSVVTKATARNCAVKLVRYVVMLIDANEPKAALQNLASLIEAFHEGKPPEKLWEIAPADGGDKETGT